MQRVEFKVSVFVFAALIGVASVLYFEPVAKPAESSALHRPMFLADDSHPTLRPVKVDEKACPDPVSDRLLREMLEVPEIADGLQSDIFACSKDLEHTKVDLNNDGRDEHIVSIYVGTMCGSKGNCPLGIFSDTPEGFRRLYYHPAKIKIDVLKSRAGGYNDIESAFNSGVYGQYVEVLRFKRNLYKRTKCFVRHPDETIEDAKCWQAD